MLIDFHSLHFSNTLYLLSLLLKVVHTTHASDVAPACLLESCELDSGNCLGEPSVVDVHFWDVGVSCGCKDGEWDGGGLVGLEDVLVGGALA